MGHDLVKCADGRWAPGVLVCKHLLDGTSSDWRRVPEEITGPRECDDWLCPACVAAPLAVPVEDLRMVCMHCAAQARREAMCRQGGVRPGMTRAEMRAAGRRRRSGWWR